MTEPGPPLTDKAKTQAEQKHARLAEALRANLHRRKAQARARAVPGETLHEGGISEGKEGGDGPEDPSP